MSRKTVCQKQPLFRERDQDKNPTLLHACLFVLYSWEWDDWSDFVCAALKPFLLQRCYCLGAKRYPHVNLIYLEGRIDPSTWLTIMLWRELGRPDFEAAKVIICPMLKLQMELGFKQKMAFNTKGAKRDSIRKLCPLNRMVLRSLAKNRTIFDSKSFWSLTTISWLSFFSHIKKSWGFLSKKNEVKKSICHWVLIEL